MNDGLLVVNFGALQQAGADIRKALSALETQLCELERVGGRLVATWEGQAKEAYYERQSKWQTASKDMQIILRDIENAVGESARDYLCTEKKATSLFS